MQVAKIFGFDAKANSKMRYYAQTKAFEGTTSPLKTCFLRGVEPMKLKPYLKGFNPCPKKKKKKKPR